MSKSMEGIEGFFDGRSDEEIERMKETLKIAFPPPDASAKKRDRLPNSQPRAATPQERKIIEAQDILFDARNCVDCLFLAAGGLGDETDSIRTVTLLASRKIDEAIVLLGEYRHADVASGA